ncbi:MAG: Signal transduction histidine kinase CheA [Candidatus Ozemobacter sibiricus]|jgi:two-component system chemotaxis sensor kinase CheA|uniref:Chemotaxis protein CheA n=1 Tax=Candidatus Ozemobacter sibiricus TaxID=2268124 RepID=A0A367ZLV8_9BACT|nr:MAG: Signal transduction histidine kinase CheA [Candidatus Ozemobacter sibiricus]
MTESARSLTPPSTGGTSGEASSLELLLRTTADPAQVRDLLASLVGDGQATIEEVAEPAKEEGTGGGVQLLGQILVERGAVSPEALNQELAKQKPIGERLVEQGLLSRDQVDDALREQRRQKEAAERRVKSEAVTSIRVSSLKLDKLVNLIGELVTVQERLAQATATLRETSPDRLAEVLQAFNLNAISEEVSRLTNGLRDNALSIRMLPIEATFSKFKRLVHDLAVGLGKEIELTTAGGETEIDKTVIDKLDEPLMHLIRNSADHGIEPPAVREAAGKPRKGTIHLSAEHVGGHVVIHVRDDGGGLRREAILAKAIERKLVPPGTELSDKEIFSLIFLPGFSTATQVTNVSGRGVGMDVVKKTIEDLRGTLDIASVPGQGTQVDITLPLTLAIIDGLLVTLAGQSFILPLSVVEECIQLRQTDHDTFTGKNLVEVRGQMVPFIPLRQRFGMAGDRPAIEQVVICHTREARIGLLVDAVIGEHKTVIKPLGKMYRRVPEFSGATILGDGSIALIIDVSRLTRQEQAERLH